MQITNSVVCGASKGCIYKQTKSPLVGEHAFPLTGLFARRLTLQYQPSSENKGADQLRGNHEADLRLCFPICKPEDQWSCKRSPDILA